MWVSHASPTSAIATSSAQSTEQTVQQEQQEQQQQQQHEQEQHYVRAQAYGTKLYLAGTAETVTLSATSVASSDDDSSVAPGVNFAAAKPRHSNAAVKDHSPAASNGPRDTAAIDAAPDRADNDEVDWLGAVSEQMLQLDMAAKRQVNASNQTRIACFLDGPRPLSELYKSLYSWGVVLQYLIIKCF